jgi:hypothetical protein
MARKKAITIVLGRREANVIIEDEERRISNHADYESPLLEALKAAFPPAPPSDNDRAWDIMTQTRTVPEIQDIRDGFWRVKGLAFEQIERLDNQCEDMIDQHIQARLEAAGLGRFKSSRGGNQLKWPDEPRERRRK